MKRFHAYDEKYNRYVATVEPSKYYRSRRQSDRNRAWSVNWTSGRSPEYFADAMDAKAFVQRLYSRELQWQVTIK